MSGLPGVQSAHQPGGSQPPAGGERLTLLGDGTVVTGGADLEVLAGGAVVWNGERIVAVGGGSDLRRRYPGATLVDAHGGLILPGLVNLHHHFYSALARGLDPGTPMRTFPEVLDRLWWRLDRALDRETVFLSALLSAADCVRWGCTTVFDHHASPSVLAGSLDLVARAVEEAGISAVLCYEVTDRNGHDDARAGFDENLRFLAAHHDHPRLRGMIGLHASFTLDHDTLEEVAARRPEGAGIHVHLAEDPVDGEATRASFGVGPVDRLARHGLLDDRCLLAHGIHLEASDYARIGRAGGVLVHNPESNANNGVGRLDPLAAAGLGCRVGLGTDGMSSAMLRALRAAFLALRGGRRDPSVGFSVLPGLLATNAEVAGRFLGEPLLGRLVPGAPADLVVVDAPPPTPIDAGNLFAHLVYGASEAPVRHTVARGRMVLEDFSPTTFDPQELAARARERAPELWRRFHALEWGTPYLGERSTG